MTMTNVWKDDQGGPQNGLTFMPGLHFSILWKLKPVY